MSDLDEELRARLAGIDPAPPSSPVDPITSPRAHELLERTMLTTDTAPDPTPRATPTWWRRPAVLAAAASLVLVAGIGAVTTLGGPDPEPRPTSITLAASDPGAAMSCIPFEVSVLRTMPVALSASVTAVEPDAVTLDVDRWYAGGTADQVRISPPAGGQAAALEGGPAFEVGQRYLITAAEGVVSSCGYSGPYSEELAQSFQEAFPG